ncbi:MAG: hypothetical protein ABUS79_30515, partial [Pseudomonadota bacterium]
MMLTGARCRALWLVVLAGALVAPACRSSRRSRPPSAGAAAVAPAIAPIPPSTLAAGGPIEPAARALRRCFSEQPAWFGAPVSDLLDRAGNLFDDDDFAGALACAEEAARAAPRSVEAHHDRAVALLHLSRLDEARD